MKYTVRQITETAESVRQTAIKLGAHGMTAEQVASFDHLMRAVIILESLPVELP